jgi:hypothetical protein
MVAHSGVKTLSNLDVNLSATETLLSAMLILAAGGRKYPQKPQKIPLGQNKIAMKMAVVSLDSVYERATT